MARTSRAGRGRTGRKSLKRELRNQSPTESNIYQEMLEEVDASSQISATEEGRSIKKRRIGGRLITRGDPMAAASKENAEQSIGISDRLELFMNPIAQHQTVYEDTEVSEDSDDAGWEEVELHPEPTQGVDAPAGDLDLTLGGDSELSEREHAPKRKVVTATERALRLALHKTHILGLLYYCHLRNHWCNDMQIQMTLKKHLSKSVLEYFKKNDAHSQFQQSRSLTDGLEKASEIFRQNFSITSRGTSRSYWADSATALAEFPVPDDIDLPLMKGDFQILSETLTGSRDSGAQLFCAMLRAAGLEVRLVSSLQTLSFSGTTRTFSPHKPPVMPRVAYPETREGMQEEDSDSEAYQQGSCSSPGGSAAYTSPHAIPRRVQRLGQIRRAQPRSQNLTTSILPKSTKKRIRESPYPVFWVEVFNAAIQKWIAIDPLVTKTIAKHSKLEPPASDTENNMSYVIAFEEDGYARDVTRRYVKAYNAKTRRSRVEITKGGSQWWKRVMRMFRSSFQLDREQVEDAELAAKEAQEPMPRNINEFHNHPYYALERHLRQNEVLHPRRQVGKVSAGHNKPLEGVYRRGDVHVVKSADAWFRLGREIKNDEQPLKHHKPRRREKSLPADFHEEDEFKIEATGEPSGAQQIPMYAAFQTLQYCPPAISNGMVPKNMYGNIDVYTPSMVPAGGVWISHPFAAGASKLLGIDHADAVTGFVFKGRTGTAVVNGVVVAGEFHDAVIETIRGFEYAFEEEEVARRSDLVLRTWKRFLVALRIRQRIESYIEESQGDDDRNIEESETLAETSGEEDAGGFLPDAEAELSNGPNQALTRKQTESSLKDSGPLGRAFEDSKAPIVSTWGKPHPSLSNDQSTNLYQSTASQSPANSTTSGRVVNEENSVDLQGGFLVDDDDVLLPNRESSTDKLLASERDQKLSILSPEHDDTYPEPNLQHPNEPANLLETQDTVPPEMVTFPKDEIDMIKEDEDDCSTTLSVAQPALQVSLEQTEASSSRSSDKDSLLSHDPDDEDATPEWLA